ncbi:site-specific DNA-methyltransferase [Conchiformibius steedae DSM 2580]|uniref:site-specific DNA-methyltransferase (adenine-specific) n=1 Tax=Conchiformibius steedae DSM 2580 TaxID=1121352 RepID=A0AAE9HVB3_9NEIS|nr:site-specific DNA-methyltransferase [Conchiformibius steedae]URD68593.1 site-specific DNA-methyltransferase [Conchiformibius steedae DSM 2580]
MQFNRLYSMAAEQFLPLLDNSSINMIYIDPPYNTQSKQFEYNDSCSDWEIFIEPLLHQARDKLREDGCIFISIDDNQMVELRQMGNKVFGKDNFLGMLITRQATRSNAKHINVIHEYIVAYAKNKKLCPKFEMDRIQIPFYREVILNLSAEVKKCFQLKGIEEANLLLKEKLKEYENIDEFSWIRNYSIVDELGQICFAKDLSVPSPPNKLVIEEIGLHLEPLKTRGWSSKEKFIQLHQTNRLIFKNGRPYEKHLLQESKDSAMSILNFYSRQGKHDLEKLGMGHLFKTAKPVEMIKYLVKLSTSENDVILDFFAGSGTTAQAVIECNLEEKSNRKFILCQIPEKIKNNQAAVNYMLQNGYSDTIDGIAQMRLDRLRSEYGLNEAFLLSEQQSSFHF